MDVKISKASGNDITLVVTPQAKQTIVIDRNIKGDTGATGATGATGSAATIAVGTTTTGAAGSNANVTNSGTSSAATFNFTIPQGIKGDTGAGVITGGTTGQVLAKASATNYDTTWITPTIGTVTQVAATAGTGIAVSGSPITSSGTLTITNTAPDQTVALTAGTGITTSGTYPNFTITNSAPDRTVAFTNGTGISTTGTYPNFTITNTAPDQTVALTGAGTTTVTGTYPNFTITSTGSSGTVTGVTGTAPIVSSGGTAPAISITSSGANSAVLRDANLNISANSISEGYSNVAAAGTTTVLIASSVPNYVVTGSGGQTYQLPDATTLPNGTNYQFNNNQSSGTIVVKNNSTTTIATVQSGGFVDVVLLSNATAAGSWDVHAITPSNVSWSTNTFDYPGSITSATWNGATVQPNRGGTGLTYFPIPANSPYTVLTYSATPTLTANTNVRITCTTGGLTINPPSGTPADGTMIRLWLINPTTGGTGTAVNIALNTSIKIPTSSSSTSPISLAVGVKMVLAIQYDATSNFWQLATLINGYSGY